MLSDEQDEALEQCQAHALRCIYGMGVTYSEMRRRAGVTTLRDRRVEQCDKFASKCLKSDRFGQWFPLVRGRRSGRGTTEKYQEITARCKRQMDTPLFYMRRRLNGKVGKVYGERNKDRRNSDYVGGVTTDAWKKNVDQ